MSYPIPDGVDRKKDREYDIEVADSQKEMIPVKGDNFRFEYVDNRVSLIVFYIAGAENGRVRFTYDNVGQITELEKTGNFPEKSYPALLSAVYQTNLVLAGGATEATLLLVLAQLLIQLDVALSTRSSEATLEAIRVILNNALRRSENELWNAADTGILIFGRDVESFPNRYRAIRLDADGSLENHPVNIAHDQLAFINTDFNTGGPTDIRSSLGIIVPSGAGPVVVDPRNLTEVAGTAQTPRDWSPDFQNLTDNSDANRFRTVKDVRRDIENGDGYAGIIWSNMVTGAFNQMSFEADGADIRIHRFGAMLENSAGLWRCPVYWGFTKTGGVPFVALPLGNLNSNFPMNSGVDRFHTTTYVGAQPSLFQMSGFNHNFIDIDCSESPIILDDGDILLFEFHNDSGATKTGYVWCQWTE